MVITSRIGICTIAITAALFGCGEHEMAPPAAGYVPDDYDYESYLSETRTTCCSAIVSGSKSYEADANDCGGEICELTAQEMAKWIKSLSGRTVFVMIYQTTCPRSQAVFKQLIPMADEFRDAGHEFVVMATDDDVGSFLEGRDLPFARLRLLPWKSGDLGLALRSVNIIIGNTYAPPLIGVLDELGSLVGSWDPGYDYDIPAIRAAIEGNTE